MLVTFASGRQLRHPPGTAHTVEGRVAGHCGGLFCCLGRSSAIGTVGGWVGWGRGGGGGGAGLGKAAKCVSAVTNAYWHAHQL